MAKRPWPGVSPSRLMRPSSSSCWTRRFERPTRKSGGDSAPGAMSVSSTASPGVNAEDSKPSRAAMLAAAATSSGAGSAGSTIRALMKSTIPSPFRSSRKTPGAKTSSSPPREWSCCAFPAETGKAMSKRLRLTAMRTAALLRNMPYPPAFTFICCHPAGRATKDNPAGARPGRDAVHAVGRPSA